MLDAFEIMFLGEWGHNHRYGNWRYDDHFSDAMMFYRLQEQFQIEPSHDVGDVARFECRGMRNRKDRRMEHGEAEKPPDFVIALVVTVHELVLRDKIVVTCNNGFWQTCRPATEKSSGFGRLSGFEVVKADPVLFAELQQSLPRFESFRNGLPQDVEDQDSPPRYFTLRCYFKDRCQHLRLGDDVSRIGSPNMVCKLIGCVCRIGRGENPPGANCA